MSENPNVIVAEDDEALARELVDSLNRYSLNASAVHSWTSLLSILEGASPGAIILDQRLADVDTLPRLPELRGLTAAPIMILTGNREETDRIVGLELGADDFLLKPISGRELVARVRAMLRRGGAPATGKASEPSGEPAPVPSAPGSRTWRIDRIARTLTRPDGGIVRLTTAEFDLLAMLTETPGAVLGREHLTKSVFHREWRPGDRAVDGTVMNLRAKLARFGRLTEDGTATDHDIIVTVRNAGYAFVRFPEV